MFVDGVVLNGEPLRIRSSVERHGECCDFNQSLKRRPYNRFTIPECRDAAIIGHVQHPGVAGRELRQPRDIVSVAVFVNCGNAQGPRVVN